MQIVILHRLKKARHSKMTRFFFLLNTLDKVQIHIQAQIQVSVQLPVNHAKLVHSNFTPNPPITSAASRVIRIAERAYQR